MLRITMILSVLFWAAISARAQDNWLVLDAPDKSFRVTGPGKPTYEKMPHRVAGKEIVVHSYLFIEVPYAFLLGYGDYPADYFAKRKAEDVLKLDQQRFLKNTGAKLVKDKLTTYQGKPAAEFVAHSEDNQSIYQVRMVLVGQRLYILAVSFPVDADTKPVIRFLDSFHILEEKK
ncbi:MAG: hypothetical protein RMJ19_11215 [Gemmatales bacterium]|nr:hypothetical protein [Gemmatales bacterium]MCS7161030.1 hypothetical protein [Gemmatales bacterium]MDW8176233.1 hypothetical protein [Gemmatales bacterium]MDW8223587.1 hypothetical protein [Gemmatales bacterium]